MENPGQSDTRSTLFADLLLPVPVPKFFTYRVPLTLNDLVTVGHRAIVQFGDRKILTGIIVRVHETPPKDYEAKYILDLLDEIPAITEVQMRFFEWMADYYMCTPGEVMNAALPAGLKLSSESMVQLHPGFRLEETDQMFSEKEHMLLNRLVHGTMTYSEISKFLGVRYIYSILKSLAGKNAIVLFEEVKEKYKPKTEKRLRLQSAYSSVATLETLFDTLASKPKQEAVILKYLQHVPVFNDPSKNSEGIARKNLVREGISESSLQTLLKNGVFEEFEKIVPRFETDESEERPTVLLSEEQEQAQAEIFRSFEKTNTTLLHGVTGSGKTEIYINLIRKALDSEAQVLYLLPEIALTTQIVQRLKKVFGNTMGIYHSRFSDNERVEVWSGVLSGQFRFVVGVRSAIFLPFNHLGLIIVDEEHDPSYKQQEPAPRYHARDAALMMARLHHAKVVLGSATPSVESFYHAINGRYGLVRLEKRFGDAQLPQVMLANLNEERKRKTMKGGFSGLLLRNIEETLSRNEQVIIFQNRRGHSPMVNCQDCGWVPRCVNCAVSLTYHQYRHALVCHYCGYRQSLATQCPTCTSSRILTVGYGTEKLEEELNLLFPERQVQRMDFDTTRTKTSYDTIIEQFEKGETDVLVGTQMVTKGLDFDRVSLVGVFNADRMMHFPDFRAFERAFQLITQVSGRAGRRENPGRVIIQTSHPDHPVLKFILNHHYGSFFNREIEDRKRHGYPPFTRLIEIILKHVDKKVCADASRDLADRLRRSVPGTSILGPAEPMISRIRNQYLMSILLKIPRGKGDLAALKRAIAKCIEQLNEQKEWRNVRVVADVDPV